MDAYSKDLRLEALGALDRGMPRKEAKAFGVSLATLKRRREGGDPSPGRILATAEGKRALWAQLEENDDATLERLSGVDPGRLVFVDESSTNIALTTLYARFPRGERAYGKAPATGGPDPEVLRVDLHARHTYTGPLYSQTALKYSIHDIIDAQCLPILARRSGENPGRGLTFPGLFEPRPLVCAERTSGLYYPLLIHEAEVRG
jgi:hypothetical protein